MGFCEHDKMMYKKLDYGMLRWIVDFILSALSIKSTMRRQKNHR